jgi:hypothetical protein
MQTPAKKHQTNSIIERISPSDVFASVLDSRWLSLVMVGLGVAIVARLFYAFS